jgi:hypothetical protein
VLAIFSDTCKGLVMMRLFTLDHTYVRASGPC